MLTAAQDTALLRAAADAAWSALPTGPEHRPDRGGR
jgi:hypothetical protein